MLDLREGDSMWIVARPDQLGHTVVIDAHVVRAPQVTERVVTMETFFRGVWAITAMPLDHVFMCPEQATRWVFKRKLHG